MLQKLIKKYSPTFRFDGRVIKGEIFIFYCRNFIRFLRGLIFQVLLLRRPKMLLMGRCFKAISANRISFSSGMKIGDFVTLSGLGGGGLIFGDNVKIDDFCRIEVSQTYGNIGEKIVIGNNVGIGSFAGIGGAGGVNIGDNTIIGQYFSCHPENHIFSDTEIPIRLQGVTRQGIVIGSNCWIGAKVSVLDGVCIGSNSVIGAGSVVTKSFPANSVLAGVPARLIRSSSND